MAISLPTPWDLGECRRAVEMAALVEEHSPGPICAIVGVILIAVGTVVLEASIGYLAWLIGAAAATAWGYFVEEWSKKWPKQHDKANLPSPVPTDTTPPGTYPPKLDPYEPGELIKIYPWLASYPPGDPTFGMIYPRIQFAEPFQPTNIPFIDRVYFPEIPEYRPEYITYQTVLCDTAGIKNFQMIVSPSIERWLVINTVKSSIIGGSIHNALLWGTNFLRGIWFSVYSGLRALADQLTNAWLLIKDTFSEIFTTVKVTLQNIYEFFRDDLWHVLTKIWGALAVVGSEFMKFVQNLWAAIYHALKILGQELWAVAQPAFKRLNDIFTVDLPEYLIRLPIESQVNTERVVGVLAQIGSQILDAITGQIEKFVEKYVPTIVGGLKGAWSGLETAFDWFGNSIMSTITTLTVGEGEVTPERAPGVAGRLFGAAIGFGVTAHLTSTVTEVFHPTHAIGLHYISAFMADMGAFSRIAAATIGVMVALAVRQPLTYYVNERVRPLIPKDMQLEIMAVKPDITIPEFRKAMAYQGYSEFWIDKIQRTMYHEPRYFELKMMSEDEAATDKWLFEKSRRGGFTVEDSKIMVSSYVKSATRTQRIDYYRQAFMLYKEGYIDAERFKKALEEMELRPEALFFSKKAADLAYLLDFTGDMIKLYIAEYKKDVITLYDLELALSTLVVDPLRASLKARQAQIAKQPKPAKTEKKEAEAAIRELQRKYTSLYILQYRKDEIDEKQLVAYLAAIGIEPELALVTMQIEKTRKA